MLTLPALPACAWVVVNYFDGWNGVPERVQAPVAIAAAIGAAITLITLPALLVLAVRNVRKASARLLLVLAICVTLTGFPLLLVTVILGALQFFYRG